MLDSLGRDVGDIKSNVQAIKNQMLQDIGKSVTSGGTDAPKEVLKKIATQLETIVGYKLDDEFKKFHNVLNSLDTSFKEINRNKEAKKNAIETGKATAKAMGSGSDPFSKAVKSLQQAANQLGGLGGVGKIPGQPRTYSGAKNGVNSIGDLCACICKCIKKYSGGGGGVRPGGVKGAEDMPSRLDKVNKEKERERGRKEKEKETLLQKANRFGKAGGSAIGGTLTGGDPVGSIIGGIGNMLSKGLNTIPVFGGFLSGFLDAFLKPLNEELEHYRDMSRSIIVTYGTGLDSLNAKLKEFEISDTDILVSGHSRSVLLKEQVKLYRRGITDAKTQNSVMRAGLQTATLIGSDAAETSGMFADWSQHLGASTHQLGMMSRGLVGIGRQSGLTGKNLLDVAIASKDFMQNMRMAGTFSATAANNMMSVMAQAQKTGTTAGTGRMMAALSGGLLGDSVDEKTKSFMMRAGTLGGVDPMKLLAGTATDKQSMLQTASGAKQIMNTYTGGRELKQMSPEEIGIISQIMKKSEGIGLKELELQIENLRKGAMSFDEQLAEVDKNLKNKKIKDPEEARVLKEGILYKQADETINKFRDNLEQMNPELKGALDKQVEILNARQQRSRVGGGFVREAGETNEMLVNRMERMDQEQNAAALDAKDPTQKIVNAINQMENMMRLYLRDLIEGWMPMIGDVISKIRDWALGPGREMIESAIKFTKETVFPTLEKIAGYLMDIGSRVLDILNFFDKRSPEERAKARPVIVAGENAIGLQRAAAAVTPQDLSKLSKAELDKNNAEIEQALKDKEEAKKLNADEVARFRTKYMQGNALGFLAGGGLLEWATGWSPIKNPAEENYRAAQEQEKQLRESTAALQERQLNIKVAEALQNAQTPEQKKALEDKYAKYSDLKKQFSEAAPWDIIGLMPELMKTQGELREMADDATKKNSIYTHDTHLEKLLEGVPTLVSAMMPGMDVDEEIQKRQIAIDDSNAEIEANTSETANNTRKTNILLSALLGAMANGRKRGGDTMLEGETLDDSPFYEQFIDYDWVDSIARMVGTTWAQGNPGKHN